MISIIILQRKWNPSINLLNRSSSSTIAVVVANGLNKSQHSSKHTPQLTRLILVVSHYYKVISQSSHVFLFWRNSATQFSIFLSSKAQPCLTQREPVRLRGLAVVRAWAWVLHSLTLVTIINILHTIIHWKELTWRRVMLYYYKKFMFQPLLRGLCKSW